MTATVTGHAPIGADVLSRTEAIALSDCEERIERGMKTFIEVGMALAAIQQNRLYRAQCDTFEEYCAVRWNFTGRRGRQLIQAAEIGTAVPIENEAQARELAKVPEEQRAEVLAEAAGRGRKGKPTAEKIREVVEERAEPKPEPDLTPDVLRALATAGATGMTAWQLAFLIDSGGPDAERAELTVRMAPILERLAGEDRACVVGEVDGGMLWALTELVDVQTPGPVEADTAPSAVPGTTPVPAADLSAAQAGAGELAPVADAPVPPREPDEPSDAAPVPTAAQRIELAAEILSVLADADHGLTRVEVWTKLPMPGVHSSWVEPALRELADAGRVVGVGGPGGTRWALAEPKVDEPTEVEMAERRAARFRLLQVVELLSPTSGPAYLATWVRQLGPYDEELVGLLDRAHDALAALDDLISEAGK
jgi:hypothetical protein